eukprot:COSAG02_NODE_347_length_24085_cov_23.240724_3_plen_84_part_00
MARYTGGGVGHHRTFFVPLCRYTACAMASTALVASFAVGACLASTSLACELRRSSASLTNSQRALPSAPLDWHGVATRCSSVS